MTPPRYTTLHAKVRREVSEGSAAANASSPTSNGPPAEYICPTCLTDLDETGFCSMCGRVETSA